MAAAVKREISRDVVSYFPVMCFCRMREKNKSDVQLWAEKSGRESIQGPHSFRFLPQVFPEILIPEAFPFSGPERCISILWITFFLKPVWGSILVRQIWGGEMLACACRYFSIYPNYVLQLGRLGDQCENKWNVRQQIWNANMKLPYLW